CIRDFHVTGVQTCALPIYSRYFTCNFRKIQKVNTKGITSHCSYYDIYIYVYNVNHWNLFGKVWWSARTNHFLVRCINWSYIDSEIGRASCRDRVEIKVVVE